MNNHKNNHMKHMLMMILCCALPILAAAVIPFLGIANSPIKSGLAAITPFPVLSRAPVLQSSIW